MFSVRLQRDGHQRHYSISMSRSAGWEVKLETDARLARHDHYRDWHRVEMARAVFAREVSELTSLGWQVVTNQK